MAQRASTAIKNSVTDNFAANFNAGTLEVRTGAQPATGDTAASGTILVSITCPNPAFASSSSGVAAKTGTWSAVASATGTAGWFRLKDSGGTKNIDGSVTAGGGGGDMIIDSTSVVSGQTVTVTAFTIAALYGA